MHTLFSFLEREMAAAFDRFEDEDAAAPAQSRQRGRP
jgi:hypothetical protein